MLVLHSSVTVLNLSNIWNNFNSFAIFGSHYLINSFAMLWVPGDILFVNFVMSICAIVIFSSLFSSAVYFVVFVPRYLLLYRFPKYVIAGFGFIVFT